MREGKKFSGKRRGKDRVRQMLPGKERFFASSYRETPGGRGRDGLGAEKTSEGGEPPINGQFLSAGSSCQIGMVEAIVVTVNGRGRSIKAGHRWFEHENMKRGRGMLPEKNKTRRGRRFGLRGGVW